MRGTGAKGTSQVRWETVRNLLIGVSILGGLALAAGGRGDRASEGGEGAGEGAATMTAKEPAVPVPALWPSGGLPLGSQETPAGLANLTAQGCNACHWETHGQWAETAHASAWRSPTYQAAVARVGDATVCTGCHLPLANQHAALASGYIDGDLARPLLEANPAWDPSLMSEGVGCAACHVREGVVLASRKGGAAPHPVVVSAELSSSAACATCHQLSWPEGDRPFYDTYGEWERSAYAAAGVSCQDCHMPPRAVPVAASTFAAAADHGFEADLRRAVSVLVSMPSPSVQRGEAVAVSVRLQNTGAGHHFPTGSPFKSYRLVAELVGVDGTSLAEARVHDLARDVEDAPPYRTLADSRIPAGGEIVLEWGLLVDLRVPAQDGIIRLSIQPIGTGEAPVVLQEIPVHIR